MIQFGCVLAIVYVWFVHCVFHLPALFRIDRYRVLVYRFCVFKTGYKKVSLYTYHLFSLSGLLLGSSTKSVSSGSVVQPTSDFLSFSDATLRTSESYTPSFGRSLVKSGSEGGASEGMVGLSTFSMLSQSSSSGKHYENCHPVGELGGLTAASYKRPQPSSSSSSATSSSSTGEDGVKKKKRGNWKNRYGPCYTSQDGKTTDTGEHGAALPSSTSPSPSSMSTLGGRASAVSSTGGVGAGGAGSSSLGIQKSPSLLRNGSLQSMTVSSPPAGPGEQIQT